MARLSFSGFETAHVNSENCSFSATGTTSFDTGTKRSGASSYKCDSGAGNAAAYLSTSGFGGVTGRNYYARLYVNLSALPGNTADILRYHNGTTGVCRARITSGGKLQLWNASAQIGSDSSATLGTGTWYRIELRLLVNTGANDDTLELLLDGTTVATTTTGDAGTAAPTSIQIGYFDTPGANKVVYLDDYALNDDQGTDQNGYPGEGRIVLLVPISDNARDTKWTGGAGGTTSLFDAVNNLPPAGLVSASATNTSQIEHAGSAAGTTDRYDANMTTYSTAGLVTGDTVKVMRYTAVTGEDIATGAKLLAFEVLSNPVMTDGGAVDVGSGAVNTYPTNWYNYANGAFLYNPTVTLGTSPVMRVRRPETASRVASCCFMGIYVEYLHFTGYTLDATGAQTYSESGVDAGLKLNRMLSAGVGSYSETGAAALLKRGLVLACAAGDYAETGVVTGLRVGRNLPVATGAYDETGIDAALTHGGTGYTLVVDAGTYAETGVNATLDYGRHLIAAAGDYLMTGVAASLLLFRRLLADPGAFLETGNSAVLAAGRILVALAGSYAETGQAALLRAQRVLLADAATYFEIGQLANLIWSGSTPPDPDVTYRRGEGRRWI